MHKLIKTIQLPYTPKEIRKLIHIIVKSEVISESHIPKLRLYYIIFDVHFFILISVCIT